MSLEIKNSRDLINPENYKLKMLLYSISGVGKTTFLGTVPGIGVAACETGHGSGIVPIAESGIPYVLPSTYQEFEQVCLGNKPVEFKALQALGLDSLSDMCKTFIKDYALTIPRARGATQKRSMGVPELDDYGTMGELTRRLLRQIITMDKHIVVTSTLRIDKPDPENGQGAMMIGPDLPGQLFLGAPAMFDLVLVLRTRPVLKDPKDPKSRYNERFFTSESDGTYVCKNRATAKHLSLLPKEFKFDLATGEGTFPWILEKIKVGYRGLLTPEVVG